MKCYRILNLEKLNSTELHKIQLSLKYEKPAGQTYHEKKFDIYNCDWKIIYGIPRIAIDNYKLLNNFLYLNQKLYQFRIVFL